MIEHKQKQLSIFFGIISLSASLVLLILTSFAFDVVDKIFGNIEIPIIMSIIGVFITLILTFLLDRNDHFKDLFQRGKYNLRWLSILVLSGSFSLVILIIYLVQTDFSLELDASVNLNFLVFLGATVLLNSTGYLFYFGIKNMRTDKILNIKFRIFSTVSSSLLIIFSITFISLYNFYVIYPTPTIPKGIGYNEGPWLTWHDNKPNESICITWLTSERNTTEVYYGENPSNLDLKATGTGSFVHKILLESLKPATTYYYHIPEDFSRVHDQSIFSFTTASNEQQSFKLAIFGDMQPDNQAMINQGKIVVEALAKKDHDFIIQLGDIADSGSDLEDWHKVLGNVARIGANKPFQAVIGNHDWSDGSGSSNWNELFSYNFNNPAVGRYYSFDYHNAHFVMIDNFEHYYTITDAQLNWIKEDITEAKLRGQDWIFCAFHLCLMSISSTGMDYKLQEKLVPIFDQLEVDAVFFAHDHDYQHYEYTYGSDGLVYDASHDWVHNEIHFFCSGGGGANLEADNGLINENKTIKVDTITWWDENIDDYRDMQYEHTRWSEEDYLTHEEFQVDYTFNQEDQPVKYYYHLPNKVSTNAEFSDQVGFQYAEQCYHYIEIDIDGSECIISAKYPNGVLIRGPDNNHPQQWILTK